MPKTRFVIWTAQELVVQEFVVRCQTGERATIEEEVAAIDAAEVIVVEEMAAAPVDDTGLKSLCLIFSCFTNT